MYTQIQTAIAELNARWENEKLKKEVIGFLKIMPEAFTLEPRAVLARQVITPNFETLKFWELACSTGIKPLGMSFVRDKFVTSNSAKVRLGKMYFFHGFGRNGGEKRRAKRVINFHEAEGKMLNEIKTLDGEALTEIHLRLTQTALPDLEVIDASEYVAFYGASAGSRYEKYLSFFVAHGILFENFLNNNEEWDFTTRVAKPAFEGAERRFGFKPLIVPLLEWEEAEHEKWLWYPGCLEDKV